jgi:outer membrane protein TolC
MVQLERALTRQRSRLKALVKRRKRLQNQLDGVEHQLQSLAGHDTGEFTLRRRKRSRYSPSLRQVVVELLTQHRKGLSMAELREQIAAAGYKSHSTNFRNVLYQCLYYLKGVKHNKKTGKYVLKS